MWKKSATFTGTLFVDLFYKRLQVKSSKEILWIYLLELREEGYFYQNQSFLS